MYAILRVDHLRAEFAPFCFAIGQHPSPRSKTVFHGSTEIEKTHGEDAGAIADLAGHHSTATKGNVTVHDFTFNRGINSGKEITDGIKLSAVFVT
ncbi:hypothetical protein D3C86_1439740 [compost metagenome]